MSDQGDVFNSQTNSGTSAPDPFTDLLKDIKADDGRQKYNTVEDAIKALKESQEFIEVLKREKQEQDAALSSAKQELSKMKTIEEFTSSLKTTAPKTPEETPAETTEGVDKGVDKDTVEKLLEAKLSERAAKEAQEKNLSSVVSVLSEAYGDKVAEHIRDVAKEYNTTPEKLKELAAENPKLAMTLMGPKSEPKKSPQTSTIYGPRTETEDNPAPKWEKGVARGGMTSAELLSRWREVGKFTNKRIGVES